MAKVGLGTIISCLLRYNTMHFSRPPVFQKNCHHHL